jgi:glyoxylase-like metal-dependent hydrolase (beta-lactamase superfamily II)
MLQTATRGPITRIHLARTILGRRLRTVEAYLVDGVLIESGPPATASEMLRWCRGRDVCQVINTHHHEDHTGGDSALHTVLGLPVAAPAQALPILRSAPRLQFYRRLVWGQPADVEARPLGDVVETPRHRFVVLPTPGHSLDHVCLFEPQEGWLFSGDLFIHERARYLRMDEDAHQILASLRHVLALRPRLLICSHAAFVEDGHRAIERKITYWEELLEQARTLREDGLSTEAITEALLGPEGLATRVSRGHFSKRNLISSLLDDTA